MDSSGAPHDIAGAAFHYLQDSFFTPERRQERNHAEQVAASDREEQKGDTMKRRISVKARVVAVVLALVSAMPKTAAVETAENLGRPVGRRLHTRSDRCAQPLPSVGPSWSSSSRTISEYLRGLSRSAVARSFMSVCF